jgi:ketosteroid isomerase-like protein
MSQENVEIIRRLYEAFNRRELTGELAALDPNFEWIPDGRSFESAIRGREHVLRFLEDQIETLDLRLQPEKFLEKGDQVIAFIRATGRGEASRAEMDISIAGVWTLRMAWWCAGGLSQIEAKPSKPSGCGSSNRGTHTRPSRHANSQ